MHPSITTGVFYCLTWRRVAILPGSKRPPSFPLTHQATDPVLYVRFLSNSFFALSILLTFDILRTSDCVQYGFNQFYKLSLNCIDN